MTLSNRIWKIAAYLISSALIQGMLAALLGAYADKLRIEELQHGPWELFFMRLALFTSVFFLIALASYFFAKILERSGFSQFNAQALSLIATAIIVASIDFATYPIRDIDFKFADMVNTALIYQVVVGISGLFNYAARRIGKF